MEEINKQFRDACLKGDICVAKNLLKYDPNISDDSYEFIFNWNCRNGRLEFAQWMLEINPNIKISSKAFRWACKKGHLKVVQWLLKITPNIKISKINNAFRWACINGHLEIANWLIEQNPDIDVSMMNDWGFYSH